MKIGELLQKFRLEQGKTRKEFASDVISPSYYCKIEKGSHRVSAEDLIELLKRNNIRLSDFFGMFDSQDLAKQLNLFHEMIVAAHYNGDKDSLEKIPNLIERSLLPEEVKKEQILIARGYLEIDKSSTEPVNWKLREQLREKVFSLPNWNEEKLTLFCNLMPLYDCFSVNLIVQDILKEYKLPFSKELKRTLLGIICNNLFLKLKIGEYEGIDKLVSIADAIPSSPDLVFYKNNIIFYKNMALYKSSNATKYLKKCQKAIEICAWLGMEAYAQHMSEFLEG
ncbi:helix-turn-helix domain-containing protein [Lactobacillus jensenii]|uniref:helix-turn-helix domain-containing protein n=1 Tax=Lactobacillus jensenii TaxID=109790 RepID=UPI0021BD51C5|nr:Rgg/GadR/MutR family transcriptional regulator [Lactobacillus jensenii]MCW8072211.1 helix-turn-helix domain-containing protein [Lactobacillus jensenii]MDK6782921.1 helix-turn-helix domain-containing protein [Lactobacillus jensenii]MDK7319366.1 helix-turn-helix domain-containing protein [Lactobacillus jensenii]MDK8236379.1 helix-turn-helix domain-containing protein [Lactobacillus jensenii]MDT9586955.1 helix-turn-helix domain-containing protein [Lactobacillus jensenii]